VFFSEEKKKKEKKKGGPQPAAKSWNLGSKRNDLPMFPSAINTIWNLILSYSTWVW
jgi:hypothetical protein